MYLRKVLFCFLMLVAGSGCRSIAQQPESTVKALDANEKSFYTSKIQPIFDQKCVACHACSQSPCQVNLTSYEGVRRGAKKLNVYAKRLTDVEPVRLFVDGNNEGDWRAKGFWPIVGSDSPSILWEMVSLKNDFPNERIALPAEEALLKADMCQSLDDDHQGDIESFRRHFRRESPLLGKSKRGFGMPYGLPGLTPDESASLRLWLDQGAPGPNEAETRAGIVPKSTATASAIGEWENFLNGSSVKEQLVARYLYEHLFLGSLYFGNGEGGFQHGAEDEYYRLVRTDQKDGPVTRESSARHPYDDANLGGSFFYRFRKISQTRMHKNHVPYELGPKKLARIKELFFQDEWTATRLPPYGAEGANPFRTYIEIPAWARYQFLLDDAAFFTRSDIRGPVCSGKYAINVIQDLGWRTYLKPTSDVSVTVPDFFRRTDAKGRQVADLLRMPAETQGSTVEAVQAIVMRDFLVEQKAYVKLRDGIYAEQRPKLGIEDLWDGNGNAHRGLKHGPDAEPGAVQTILRHFDSAEVLTGLHGNLPKTAEVLDFPIMERTYYDLVTGFDVFGSSLDGINIRAYKDALRIEGEDGFLKLVPTASRESVRDYWYFAKLKTSDLALKAWMKLWNPFYPEPSPARDTLDTYEPFESDASGKVASEAVMRRVAAHFRKLGLGKQDYINCPECGPHQTGPENADVIAAFRNLKKTGPMARHFPEIAFVRIGEGGEDDLAFSLVTNRFRTHTKYLLGESATEVPELDELMVLEGLAGSYPNIYFSVPKAKLAAFLSEIENVSSKASYETFRKRWGVDRDSSEIWAMTDWFYRQALRRDPTEAARFDLVRYEIFYQ